MLGSLPHRSSPEAAELSMKTYDLTFASRPKSQFSEFIFYGPGGMVTTEYGPYWHNMRKLCILQLHNSSKVQSYSPLRRKELGLVVMSLRKKAVAREVVDMSEVVKKLVEDMTYMMVLGRKR